MNEFKRQSGIILGAKVRTITNTKGDNVQTAILVLDNGTDVLAPVTVMQNVLDRAIQPSEMRVLNGSTLYYDTCDVKQGDTFSFVPNGEEAVAEKDLHITNVKAVVLTDKADEIVGAMPSYVPENDDTGNTGNTGSHSEEYLDELNKKVQELTNVQQARQLVQEEDIFDDYAEKFAELTTAQQFKDVMLEIIEQ